MLQLRLEIIPAALVSKSANNPYTINRSFSPVLSKVEGEPGIDPKSSKDDALREAFVAWKIASRPNVTKVLLGASAYKFIHPQQGKPQINCDAVGLTGNQPALLGEGKGQELIKCLRQLDGSARAIANGANVYSAVVTAVAPLYLWCEPGPVTVTTAKGHWRLSNPTSHRPGALESANNPNGPAALDPRFFYLLVPDGVDGALNGLGLAVSRTGDNFLYTNRNWNGTALDNSWGPIRKLTLPGAGFATVDLYLTAG